MNIRDESPRRGVSMDPIRVLHVDTDPTWTAATAECLERAEVPIETLSVTSASDGLDRLEHTEIDCLVSEYELPEMDGLAFFDAVRATHEEVPFVLYTDSGSEALASEAIGAGVTDYVPKDDGSSGSARLRDGIIGAIETARDHSQCERQLRAVETAREGISLLDDAGQFVYVNQSYADLYGYEPAELIGEHWGLLYPDEDIETVRDEIIPTVMAEGDWYGETTGLRADGSTFVEAHSLSTTGNGDLICTVREMTDRKERERDLERYETIIDALGDPVYTVDSAGRYAFVNDAYAEMTGYEKSDIVGKHVSFLLDEPSVEGGEACITSLLSDDSERQRTYEITVETSDGERIRCEDHLSLLPLENGRYRGVAGVVRNITERKARERELERYETILETIPDEVYTLDADGYLTEVVPPINAEETTTGYEPEEMVGEHVSIIMDDDDIDTAESEIEALLCDDDREHVSFEMETITKDGERHPNENHIAALPTDEDGHFSGTVGVLRNISDRKARERELTAQNERLNRFAGIVSHDLRNPLNVAQGHLEQARETDDCTDEDLEAVAWAHDRMAVLIENLLTVARERDPDPNTEPVDLATLTEDCWRHVETAAAALEIETDAVVQADRARLTQLLENLISNSVEHGSTSPASGSQRDAVEHGSTSPDSQARQDAVEHDDTDLTLTVGELDDADGNGFFVADDGSGIPADERDEVFESGYSSDGAGTGLGLAIVERIAEAHGWTVTVTEGDNGGARFELTGVDLVDRPRTGGDEE
ncbi:PAS domain S-box protein [Natrinema sp. SYSU A 869]|uniref:PAS domain S-box protein n=1 Tax=Natrinema sp. SYSU A 869 TaxID=2871694 RepID=UPI001CA394EC|nr:PAS domain S-box protein [Natrinema sp. SYSU A 869]